MIFENNKISLRQFQALLIIDVFGASVIVMPRLTADIAGQNGWLLIIGAGIIVFLYSHLIHFLCMQFPGKTFVEISQTLLTKPVGFVLSVGLSIKILITTGMELRIFCEIIKQTMLLKTPTWACAISMLFVCAYVAMKGYETRARVAEILFFLVIVSLTFIFIFASVKTDFTNLLPLFNITSTQLAYGSVETAFSFHGLELLLLVFPVINKVGKSGKVLNSALFIIIILMLLTTIITFARFGPDDVKHKLWPALQMLDTIDVPGSFVERQDIIMMSFWIISTFAGVNSGLFLTAFIGERLFGSSEVRKPLVIFFIPVLLAVSLLTDNIAQTYALLEWTNKYMGFLYLVAIPIILLIISGLRFGFKFSFRKEGGNENL